jgi:hypothetical protein
MRLISLITLFVAQFAFASLPPRNTLYKGTVTGQVVFEKKWTMTCMALGCPPSRPYTEVSLTKANITGYGQIEKVLLETDNKLAIPYDNSMTIKGTKVRPGMVIQIKGETTVRNYMNPGYPARGFITKIQSVKVVR